MCRPAARELITQGSETRRARSATRGATAAAWGSAGIELKHGPVR